MAKLAIVHVVARMVIWPPMPCHIELESAATILPINAGVQDARDFKLILRGVFASNHWVRRLCVCCLAREWVVIKSTEVGVTAKRKRHKSLIALCYVRIRSRT